MDKIPLIMDSVLNAVWAILPSKLSEIMSVLQSKNDGLLLQMVEQSKQSKPQDMNYSVKDGIAEIVIQGTLSKRIGLIQAISGGTSYSNIQNQVKRAEGDPNVRGIFYQYDTPGGHVDGVFSTIDVIAKGQKPSLAFVDGLAASAAYMLASASDFIAIADRSTETGSLGTVAVHLDESGKYQKEGIKPTVFASGRYKKIGNPYEPLSNSDKKHMQKSLDYMYSLMVDAISENRNISVKDLIDNDIVGGSVFIGKQSIDAGLVDEILTRELALKKLKDVVSGRENFNRKTVVVKNKAAKSYTGTKSERRINNMKVIQNFNLKSIAESIQGCDSLDELKSLENECLLHFAAEAKTAANWIKEEEVKATGQKVTQLADLRRRQILALPGIEEARKEYELGKMIGQR